MATRKIPNERIHIMYTQKRLIANPIALYAVSLFFPAGGGQIGLSTLYVGIV